MSKKSNVEGREEFWAAAADIEGSPGVTRSTMMGFPCLRVHNDFFASVDPAGELLIVRAPCACWEAPTA